MSKDNEDGGMAFPHVELRENTASWPAKSFDEVRHAGMSLRDWFAGQALAGMLNSKALAHLNYDVQAATAYQYADAMLAERAKC